MLDNKITLSINLYENAWKENADGKKSKLIFMKLGDFEARIKDDKNNEIGSIAGALGGTLVFRFQEQEHVIVLADLWNAYCTALEKPEYKLVKKPSKPS